MSAKGAATDIEKLRKDSLDYLHSAKVKLSAYPIEPKDWSSELRRLPGQMKIGIGHFLQDDPADTDDDLPRLLEMISDVANPSEEEVRIVSPYFIPGNDFLKEVEEIVNRGIKVKFLTGSLGSNNHTMLPIATIKNIAAEF